MRSLNLGLSLALLLCLQAYAADPLVGTWSSPQTNVDTSENCCVPDKIEIVKDGSDYQGTYFYTFLKNGKCTVMLGTSKGNNVKFTKKSNSDVYGISVKIFEDVEIFGVKVSVPIEGYLSRVLSNSQLEIYNPTRDGEAEAQTCDFTMTEFKPASSSLFSNIPISYIAMGVGGLLLVLCIACKCRQKKQIVIIQQESAYGHQPYYGQKGPVIQTR